MTENLQREDLNPIDQAKGILAYIQAKHPDKGYNLDGVMSDLMKVQLRPDDLPEDVVFTVNTVAQISGKSYPTLFSTISLLKLVPKIQDVISNGKLPVSQGYLFAANLGSPDFFIIFDEIMETPVTNVKLEKMLTAYKRRKPESTDPKPIPMKIKVASIEAAKTYFEKKTGMYTKNDLQTLAEELKAFLASIEQQIETAPEAVSMKQTDKKSVPQV
ncbi:MAG: hypothetical protein NT010_12090 [Proteobacteria bacterium]|nr:hypothetical protein [Pseudomonadota bacterium]